MVKFQQGDIVEVFMVDCPFSEKLCVAEIVSQDEKNFYRIRPIKTYDDSMYKVNKLNYACTGPKGDGIRYSTLEYIKNKKEKYESKSER